MEFPDKIIRGDGKVQHEYIRADIVDEDYNAALREGHNDGYKDATKHIRQIYKVHHQAIKDHINKREKYRPLMDRIFDDLLQAIKATLGEE